MDIPVTCAVRYGDEKLIWVDTVFDPRLSTAIAVCVRNNGQVASIDVGTLEVCEDSKPRLLLNPERLQRALAQRLGNNPLMTGPGGIQMANLSVQKISPAEQEGKLGYRFTGSPETTGEGPVRKEPATDE